MKSVPFLSALRHGPFARYIAGEGVSMVGTWMQMFAQGWVLTSLTSSAFVLGALNFTSGLPMLLLSLAGGSLADRIDKRFILHGALFLQMVTAAGIGWLIGSKQIAIWHLFVAAGLLGSVAAFEVPAVSAFVPELVPRDEMSSAIAIDRSIFHATRLIGPALGGFLVSKLGEASVYYVNATTFLALAAALLTIPRRARTAEEEEAGPKGDFLSGVRYVRKDEPTMAMVLLIAAMTVFVSPFLVITMPIYSRGLLHLQPDYMGYLMAVSGIGSLTGSLGLLSIPRGYRALALKIGSGAAVVALLGMAMATSFATAAPFIVLLTLGLSTCFGISNIVIQERASDELRGRISAVAGMAFFGLLPFSGLLIAWLIDLAGMRQTMMGCALGYGLTTAILLFGRRRLATAPADPPEPVSP